MSTTHIQPLPNVRGRMSYTELGEGKKRTENIREKTNRIAAQMGDMGTREDFIRFCSAMRRQSQGTRLNEGYELRVSWSPEELSKDSPEDIQRACEYGYALCKEVAPNAPCWVTVHTDGEGGCVHVHATIANHDLVSGTAIAHGTDHATVKRKNDRLSREMGFTVVGPEPARERTAWAERKGQFGIESFERVLGNRVADARDHASNMEEFLEELKVRGVERTETRKVDEKTGEETVGWSYKSRDPYGKSRRKRRRRASNLADDLTREGIEAYFEAKQRELEVPQQDAPAPEVLSDVPETAGPAEPAEQPSADFALDVYDLDRAYVSEMASDLQKAHIHRSREEGKPFMDERYEMLVEARNHPDEQLAKLREDVDAARREFYASKEALDTHATPVSRASGRHACVRQGGARRQGPRVPHDGRHDRHDAAHDDSGGARGGAPQAARGGGEARVRVPQEHVGRREAPQGGGEGAVRRGRAREASEERAHAAPCQGGRAARAREDAEVGGQGHAVRRVAEKMREQRQAAPFSSSRSRATKRPSKGLLTDVRARGGKSGFSSFAHL